MAPNTASLRCSSTVKTPTTKAGDLMEGNSVENIWLDEAAFKVPSNFEVLPF